jgi:hypothetical protein
MIIIAFNPEKLHDRFINHYRQHSNVTNWTPFSGDPITVDKNHVDNFTPFPGD